ncbi:MAG: hypothetical protein ACJ768_21825 [Gaiellaceae bacterium]
MAEHVIFEVECIDRMYCNVYVPQLQYAAGIVGYVHCPRTDSYVGRSTA